MKTVRVLFDITREVRASGWVLDDPDKVASKLKKLLSTNQTGSQLYRKHEEERKFLLQEPNLRLSVKHLKQLQGGLRFVAVYRFDRG